MLRYDDLTPADIAKIEDDVQYTITRALAIIEDAMRYGKTVSTYYDRINTRCNYIDNHPTLVYVEQLSISYDPLTGITGDTGYFPVSSLSGLLRVTDAIREQHQALLSAYYKEARQQIISDLCDQFKTDKLYRRDGCRFMQIV